MATRTPTTDQLRHGIEHGRARDKVDFPDPAAAPLGTDAEAAGKPPTRAERRIASRVLGIRPAGALNSDLAGIIAYAVIVIPLALLILAVVLLTRPF